MEPFPFSSFFLFILFSGATKPLWSQEDAVWRDIDQERHAGGSAERQRVSADFERQPIVTTSCRSRSKILQNGSKWINMWTKHKKRMGRSKGTGRTLVFDIFWHLLDVLDMLGPALFLVSFLLEEQLWISWSQLNPDPWLCHFHCAAVAAGEYCLRENPNGVDLNRNWDEKWDLGTEHSAEQSHGKRPFSEPLDSMLSQLFNPKWLETR